MYGFTLRFVARFNGVPGEDPGARGNLHYGILLLNGYDKVEVTTRSAACAPAPSGGLVGITFKNCLPAPDKNARTSRALNEKSVLRWSIATESKRLGLICSEGLRERKTPKGNGRVDYGLISVQRISIIGKFLSLRNEREIEGRNVQVFLLRKALGCNQTPFLLFFNPTSFMVLNGNLHGAFIQEDLLLGQN